MIRMIYLNINQVADLLKKYPSDKCDKSIILVDHGLVYQEEKNNLVSCKHLRNKLAHGFLNKEDMGKVSKNSEVLGGITPVAFLDRLIENIQTRSKDKKIDIPTYVQTPDWQWWKETPRVITSDNKLRMIQEGLANVIKLKGFEEVWYNFLNWVKIDLETQRQKQANYFRLIGENNSSFGQFFPENLARRVVGKQPQVPQKGRGKRKKIINIDEFLFLSIIHLFRLYERGTVWQKN